MTEELQPMPTDPKPKRSLGTYWLLGFIALVSLIVILFPFDELIARLADGRYTVEVCTERGGEVQAVSTGLFGGGSKSVCLLPDGLTFNIIRG